MEFFKKLKVYLRYLGILPFNSSARAKIFIPVWNCILLIIHIWYFVGPLWYILSTNWTFKEVTETTFYIVTSLLIILWYSVCILQKSKYNVLFDVLDKIMEKSKPTKQCYFKSQVLFQKIIITFYTEREKGNEAINKIYEEINARIEMVSNKLHALISYIVIPLITQPPIFISIVKYISSDYSNESFLQIYPAKYNLNTLFCPFKF